MLDDDLLGPVRNTRVSTVQAMTPEERKARRMRRDIHASHVGTALWLLAMGLVLYILMKRMDTITLLFVGGIAAILLVFTVLEARSFARWRRKGRLESYWGRIGFKTLFLGLEFAAIVLFSLLFNELSLDEKTIAFITFIGIALVALEALEFFIMRGVRWLMEKVGY